jgi:L-ribulokinase
MTEASFLIGLDYGSESARGVLVNAVTAELVAEAIHPYRHGIMASALPNGLSLPPAWALQDAADYLEAAETLLALGRGRRIDGIGVGFTASSPMPATEDGLPLSAALPREPHAYVKLWKHHAAQPWADRVNALGGAYLKNFGGKVSSEWLLPKAAQLAEEAPDVWARASRFIEAGDWLVWRLTGHEMRSADFAAYKAQYSIEGGYPADVAPDLLPKLSLPVPVGRPAGVLTKQWRERCGILGEPAVAVAAIDSHVMAPAVGATEAGVFVGALGTSAAYLLLDDEARPLPSGIEGVARDGVIPGLWCYEAGQPAFGDVLHWFMRLFAAGVAIEESFARFDAEIRNQLLGQPALLALDWWNGSRAPVADSLLSGLLVGLTLDTTPADIYRALIESLCFGARNIMESLVAGGAPIKRILFASGVSERSPLIMQILADVLGRPVEVPQIHHAAAIGAAIHGAVAAGVVPDFSSGARRYGAREFVRFLPSADRIPVYDRLFRQYQTLVADQHIRCSMHGLRE